jgi:hypothetical protein
LSVAEFLSSAVCSDDKIFAFSVLWPIAVEYLNYYFSGLLGISSVQGLECDVDHFLVFAKVRERLSGNKQATQI